MGSKAAALTFAYEAFELFELVMLGCFLAGLGLAAKGLGG